MFTIHCKDTALLMCMRAFSVCAHCLRFAPGPACWIFTPLLAQAQLCHRFGSLTPQLDLIAFIGFSFFNAIWEMWSKPVCPDIRCPICKFGGQISLFKNWWNLPNDCLNFLMQNPNMMHSNYARAQPFWILDSPLAVVFLHCVFFAPLLGKKLKSVWCTERK